VTSGVNDFKSKACKDILNHISEKMLSPTTGDRLCMPLLDSYSKVFRIVVETPSHVEHFPTATIETYLQFLCEVIDAILESLGTVTYLQSSVYLFAETTPSLSAKRRLPYAAAEVLHSIYSLLNISYDIKINQLMDIWESVGRFIASNTDSSASDASSISIANIILQRLSSSNVDFCDDVSLLVFERLPEMFSSKSLAVRESILIFLQYSYPFLDPIISRIDDAPTEVQERVHYALTQLESTLANETTFASISLVLDTLDVDINLIESPPSYHSFCQKYFHLKSSGNTTAWVTMLSYYKIMKLKHTFSNSTYFTQMKRRKRLSTLLSNTSSKESTYEEHVFTQFINDINPSETHLVRNLQSFILHMQKHSIPKHMRNMAFLSLCHIASNKNIQAAGWSLLAICHLLKEDPLFDFGITELNNLWNDVCKRFYHPAFSSIASFFFTIVISQNRISAAHRKTRLERLLGMFDSSGPQLSKGSYILSKQLLWTCSSSNVEKLPDALEKLFFWVSSQWQIDLYMASPGHSFPSISPGIVASLILELFAVKLNYVDQPLYEGSFQLAFFNMENFQTGLDYIRLHTLPQNQTIISIKPTLFISNSSNEFKVNSIASLLEICERTYEGLLDSENLSKFTSYPALYGKVVAFTTSLLIVASKLEQANPDFHSECRSLGLKLQLMFMELCSISTKVAFQKDHASHFLFGARFLVEAESFFHNSFYNEVYGQAIGNLLGVLDRQVEVTSSFGDDVLKTETFVKMPASSNLHSYNFSRSNWEVQLYQTYSAARLLHKKLKSELNLLEALYQLFRDAPEKEQIAAMSVVLIDYFPKLDTSSAALTLQGIIREIGENVLSSYEWDRTETIILFCIKLLSSFITVWIDNEQISSDCFDIFNWLCKLHLEGGYKNYLTEAGLSQLIVDMVKHKPGFHLNDESVPIDHLSKLLTSSMDLFYKVSPLLPEFFQCYSYDLHITFFNIIQDNIGHMVNQTENLAARCYLLSYLAKSSDTLLIGSVFNIIELDQVPQAVPFIPNSISEVSGYYGYADLKSFFNSQSDELFYLWFSNDMGRSFPAQYFGFPDNDMFLKEHYEMISVLEINTRKKDSISVLEDISAKVGLQNHKALIKLISQKTLAFELASLKGNYISSFWLVDILGKTSWNTLISHNMPSFVASLFLLTDFSEIDSLLPDSQNGFFSKIYNSEYKAKSLADFPQPLVPNSQVILLLKKVIVDVNYKESFQDLEKFTLILRIIINKLITSVDPNQKGINLRRLLYVASNYGSSQLRGYALKMILKAITHVIPYSAVRDEAFRALRVLIDTSIQEFITHGELLFEVLLSILLFFFKQKLEKKNTLLYNLDWISDVNTRGLKNTSNHFYVTVKAMLSWLKFEKAHYSDESFIWTVQRLPKIPQKAFLDIVSIELDSNVDLQTSLLSTIDNGHADFLNLLVQVEPIFTKGYTTWLSRLLGKHFSAVGDALKIHPLDKSEYSFSVSRRVYHIFCEINQLLSNHDLMIVGIAEDAVRYIQTFITTDFKGDLKMAFTDPVLRSLNYYPLTKQYHLESFKFDTLLEYAGNTDEWVYRMNSTFISAISAQHKEFVGLQELIAKVPTFGQRVFPFLLITYLYVACKDTDPTLDSLVMDCIEHFGNSNVNNLILKTFFHLRESQFMGRGESRFLSLDNSIVVKYCLDNFQSDLALYFAEFEWSCASIFGFHNTVSDQQLAQTYETVSDPDMFYAIPVNPSLTGILTTYQYENNTSQLLQYQSALMDEDMVGHQYESSLPLSKTFRNSGMQGISKVIMDSMSLEDDTLLYSQAWKLQQWDLAQALEPNTSDEIIFNLHKSLHNSNNVFDSVYDAYSQTLSLLRTVPNAKKPEMMKTLSIIQESEDIMNVEDISSARELSTLQLKKSENLMNFSKYVFFFFFFFLNFHANLLSASKQLKTYNFQDNSVGKHVNPKHLTEHFRP
jgi:hypothetical protein